MALMTTDCVFENTMPPPDGFWERFFASTPKAVFRWTFHWDDRGGHVRGVDVLTVRDGKVAQKLSYVKG